jgi:hypothetical protein
MTKIPKRESRQIRKAIGIKGVRLYRLLLELADQNGEIHFEGSEEDMIREIQKLYAVTYGGKNPDE